MDFGSFERQAALILLCQFGEIRDEIRNPLKGRDLVQRHRYAEAKGEAVGIVARVITYGISRRESPPA